jgi:ligand-binding SRPBCC domain-containing protein
MSVHRFETTHRLPMPREEAWRFFSDPRNLARITPPEMGFTITSDVPDEIYPGLMITYQVRPLFNLPFTWVTEITHVVSHQRFVDEQRAGPYAMWHHEHDFRDVLGGTEMHDIVHYAVPGGPIGDVINSCIVTRKIADIFAHRRSALNALFGALKEEAMPTVAG